MDKVTEFRNLKRQIQATKALINVLKNEREVLEDIEFEQQLRQLMLEYQFTLSEVIQLLDPASFELSRAVAQQLLATKRSRKKRATKYYVNPNTGETAKTKGGNHSILKLWKSQHGAAVVDSWLTCVKP